MRALERNTAQDRGIVCQEQIIDLLVHLLQLLAQLPQLFVNQMVGIAVLVNRTVP